MLEFIKDRKTGEILRYEDGDFYHENGEVAFPIVAYSIAELHERYEDYAKPEEFWHITGDGEIVRGSTFVESICGSYKFIGNHFSSKEEAEKAVEKLKAFANLRKRGLKFNGWDEADRGMVGEFVIYCDALELDGIERELEIAFGREEL